MRLILVRHAETEANVNRINNGQAHSPLTSRGKRQAVLTGHALKDEPIKKIYSSDLERAKDTCASIIASVNAPVEFTPHLRERNLGVFEGLPYGSFKMFTHENGLDVLSYRPEEGESIKESFDRVMSFFIHCKDKHLGETVLWVSHGAVIKRLVMHFLRPHDAGVDYHPPNCSINVLEVDEAGKVKVSCLNKADHLAE
jgi:broad specificity phosphatase PhoE